MNCQLPLFEEQNRRISRRVKVGPQGAQRFVVILGPCRVGTSALLQVFAAAGIVSYFQPFKRSLRQDLCNVSAGHIKFGEHGTVAIKETFGPFVEEEVSFSPIKILIDAGVAAENISLVSVFRDPIAALQSWHRCFDGIYHEREVDLALFNRSYQQTISELQRAESLGVRSIVYVPDLILPQFVSQTLGTLFDWLSLPLPNDSLSDWAGKPSFGSALSQIRREPEPRMFRAAGILDDLKNSSRYLPVHRSAATEYHPDISVAQHSYEVAATRREIHKEEVR